MRTRNTYDEQADQYINMMAERNQRGVNNAPLESIFFKTIGNVQDLTVLDAGCGEGFVSRLLASQGAKVTGMDISAPLLDAAKAQNTNNKITYQLHDLSQPLPQYKNHFDLIVSHMVLNDVPDYIGFITTLGTVLKPGGRAVFSLNNPYSATFRNKSDNYFESGTSVIYAGMAQMGVEVYYFHRTMEEYIEAFSNNGFLLRKLHDLSQPGSAPKQNRISYLMVIELIKTA